MVNQDEIRITECDLNLQKNVLDEQLLTYKRSRSIKIKQSEKRKKENEQIDDQNRFVDLVWSEKNNQTALL